MQLDLSIKFNSELILLSIVPSKIHHGDSSGVFGMVSQSYMNDNIKKKQKNGSKKLLII